MRGRETRRRDIEAAVSVEPQRGQDVQLTVDVHLQARMQALLDPAVGLMRVQGWHNNHQLPKLPSGQSMPLNGAAIVLEVDTGQVLAMAYSPSAGAEWRPGDDISVAPVWPSAADAPGLNRAMAAVYPPGSTLKPIVYCIAAAHGVIDPSKEFFCKGYLLDEHPGKYRCWGWRPERGSYGRHGSIGPVRAIAESCNIYFYSCGRELGAIRLVQGLQRWGYGQSPGMGLDPAEAVPGLLPEPGGVNPAGRGLTLSNAILMGIGQGPISASPLQVANAHAALARGGYWTNPVIMMHQQAEQAGHDLGLPPSVVANAWKGMYESSNTQGGTGYRVDYGGGREKTLNLPGVVTRSKTGTAQTTTRRWIDLDRDGERQPDELFGGTHSWFVCHVGPEGQDRAKYVIVVLVEYGGSGGRVSGPIVNQILYAMRAEGYL
jgi:penicillin-binding protein 2